MLGKTYHDAVRKKLGFWFKDEPDLLPFTTLKEEIKKGISRTPTDPPTVLARPHSR
jgi:hypothetical protein